MKRPGRMIKEVLMHVGAKPATVHYPFTPAMSPPKFRGKIEFFAEKCIGCKMCERDCPTGAVEIRKVGEKRFEAIFHLDKCIYCAQCVDSCPKKALGTTAKFELAELDRGRLVEVFHAAPEAKAEKKPEEKESAEKAAPPDKE